LFGRLRKYRLRLNLAKCTFRVKFEKLFGFVVSQKEIEVHPYKVKAILKIPEIHIRGPGFLRKVELHSEIHITVNYHLQASFQVIV